MEKIVLFGDSFADYNGGSEPDESVWFRLLGKKLGIDLLKCSSVGSSLEFSYNKLIKYVNSDHYSPDDLIVFVSSNIFRLPIVHYDFPIDKASQFVTQKDPKKIAKLKEVVGDSNYEDFVKYTELYLKYHNKGLQEALKTFCASFLKLLPNKTVMVSAFSDIDYVLRDDRKGILCNDENFLKINANLFKISQNEIIGSYFDLHEFFNSSEVRHAHLSRSNNAVLAEQLYATISNWDTQHFKKTQFLKNILPLNTEPVTLELYDKELCKEWTIRKGKIHNG